MQDVRRNDDTRDLKTPGGIVVPWLEKTADNYLDKTTFLFGGSNSGKSTIIEEILYLCKDYIPNYLAIAPENSRETYVSKLPSNCIKDDLTKQKLQQIWQRQTNATAIYKTANNPETLKRLFCKAPDRESLVAVTAIQRTALAKVSEIEQTVADFALRRGQINNIHVMRDKKIIAIYKKTIRQYKDYLMKQDLTLEEKTTLNFLDFNPRFMLIIDDCSEMMKKWNNYFGKNESNVFEQILYKGRHNFITLVFACHDDKLIGTELRKGARVVFYTSSQSLVAALNKTGNGYSPKEKKQFMEVADFLFHDEDSEFKTHKKFCYMRESNNPLKYTIAKKYDNFSLACDPLKELVDKLPKREDQLVNNPFIQEFVPEQKKPKITNVIAKKKKPRLRYE
jgi:hypothetical protein